MDEAEKDGPGLAGPGAASVWGGRGLEAVGSGCGEPAGPDGEAGKGSEKQGMERAGKGGIGTARQGKEITALEEKARTG